MKKISWTRMRTVTYDLSLRVNTNAIKGTSLSLPLAPMDTRKRVVVNGTVTTSDHLNRGDTRMGIGIREINAFMVVVPTMFELVPVVATNRHTIK
jgi:hypothetical protein